MNTNNYNKLFKKMNEHLCKTILLGESGVGKTSIINRYLKDEFIDNIISSTGQYYLEKIITYENDERIRFEIWDTIGQERYRGIVRNYYQGANAAILVYDISRKNSFEELKNYWINEVIENGPKNKSMLLILICKYFL